MTLACLCCVVFVCLFFDLKCAEAEKFVIGMDAGTESLRVGIFSLEGKHICSKSVSYSTTFPKPGHAEQNPTDWVTNMGNKPLFAIIKCSM